MDLMSTGEVATDEMPRDVSSAEDSFHQQSPSDEFDPALMHILHLSDLHFGTEADARKWSGQLADDLKRELNCDCLQAMIISLVFAEAIAVKIIDSRK